MSSSRYSRRGRKFVSRKIRWLAHEGVEAPRRVAQAMSMARARGLKVPRKPNAGVPEEGPSDHIRNALASLMAEAEMVRKGYGHLSPEEFVKLVRAVEARLQTALDQLERGTTRLRGNPTLAILGAAANPRVEDATIATWAKIEYMRPDDPDGDDIIRVHEFKDGFEIGWLSDGTVQLSHPRHALWVDDLDDIVR